jgi:hypothetical protein
VGKREGRDRLDDLGVDGRIILKYVLRRNNEMCWDWIYLARDREKKGRSFEDRNEISVSIKFGGSLD